jgi:stalled ribosome alternative rescue factor ArfA
MGKRNPMAKALSSPLFKPRVVKAKKGKGSYSRKGKKL